VVRTIGLLSIIIASTLVGICGAKSAPGDSPTAGQVWSLRTPFGIVYGVIGREVVDYPTTRPGGTIIVSTSQRRLYYVLGGGKAIRYGIAVGMEGYGWSGVNTITAKREWPDWSPTPGERQRFPTLPAHMAGGSDNPLGARALYLGDTLYRIHGTNEPWKLGGRRPVQSRQDRRDGHCAAVISANPFKPPRFRRSDAPPGPIAAA
jgi:lipoprotein-anchoring transpeptidase ErfK/SrfK